MKRAIVIVMGCAAAAGNVALAFAADGFQPWRIAGAIAGAACALAALTMRASVLTLLPIRFAAATIVALALATAALDAAATRGDVFAFGLLLAVAGFAVGATWAYRSLRPESESRLAAVAGGALLFLATASSLLAALERAAVAVAPLALYGFVPDDRSFGDAYTLGPDEELIGRAGYRGSMRHPEFFGIRVDLNDWGLRDGLDEATPIAREDDSVLVLGDSFAFGTGVELAETFHERLEEAAGEITPRPLRVTCAAMPGNAQTRELMTLERMIDRTVPDVVVVAFYFGNDFTDNIGTAFREAKAKGILDGLLPEKSAAQGSPALPRLLHGATRLPFWQGGSAVCAQLLPRFEDRLVALGWIERSLVPTNRFLESCLTTRSTLERDYLRDFTLQTFDRLEARCREIGARLVVLAVPALVQASRRAFDAWAALRSGERAKDLDRRGFYDDFVSRLAARGLQVADPIAEIEAAEARGVSCYHREGHWNAEGHRAAARVLVPVLRAEFAARRG
jgi:hypothetical protein